MDATRTPAAAQDAAIERLPEASLALTEGQVSWEQSQRRMMLSVIGNESLPSTMQILADAFVHRCPSKAMAIFLRSGDHYDLQAEAGLPQRPLNGSNGSYGSYGSNRSNRSNGSMPLTPAEGHSFPRSNPVLRMILASGAKLCLARPLLSRSGEAQGALAVFDQQQGSLDESTRETVLTLCDFARLAIEHRMLYDQAAGNSQYDLLTGLPNSALLEERLRQTLETATTLGTMVAVCLIDLDRFRQINDSWGHTLGDACFRAVSERLRASIRESDTLGRYSSDEFVLVLRDLIQAADATTICQRLLGDLAAPLLVEEHRLTVTAGIGLSIFPRHGDTPDALLRNAHIAVQKSKQTNHPRVRVYSDALGREHQRANEMADALVSAIAQHQLSLAYQPIYNPHREILGFEALLRWEHPKWGQVRPDEFIPIAERTGLIASIGDWVIAEACRQAVEWNAAGLPAVKLFVNVSGVQLEFSNFSSRIAETLRRSGFDPNRLELEITESWIISDLDAAAAKLQTLRDLGIRIAIDDFGTGHASFGYLQALPLDTLKIDRSFVRDLQNSPFKLSTVRAITGLAHQLGLKTVAEGVETEPEFKELRDLGCDMLQGFLFSRPLKPANASTLLKQQQCLTA